MKRIRIISCAILLALCTSCTNDQLHDGPNLPDSNEAVAFDPTQPVSGARKMENPYTLENMRAAFHSLAPQTRGNLNADDVVENTHSHIRITFRTDAEYYVAQSLELDMFYSPLDVVFEQGGYVDNEGNADGTDVRYCVATAAQLEAIKESGAEYAVLDEMFMPDEEPYTRGFTTRGGATLTPEFIARLVEAAYTLKGYEEYLTPEGDSGDGLETRAITPSGRVTYADIALVNGSPDGVKVVGLDGMDIKVTRLLKTSHGYTKNGGYYTCDKSFSNPWKYETSFERYEFAIRNGYSGAKAFTLGDTMQSKWNLEFTTMHNSDHFQATIFRAAYHYYYMDIQGLRRPPQNGTFKTQMKIAALFEENNNGGSTQMENRFLGIGNPVYIYNPQDDPHKIYGTTIHELAHTSHWNFSKSTYGYNNAEQSRLTETWARGVQYALTRMRYSTYMGGLPKAPAYTNLVKDMMDTESDFRDGVDFNIRQGDNVSGYTIKQVEDCMIGTTTWSQFRQKLYNNYPNNSTRGNLQTLFDAWANYK